MDRAQFKKHTYLFGGRLYGTCITNATGITNVVGGASSSTSPGSVDIFYIHVWSANPSEVCKVYANGELFYYNFGSYDLEFGGRWLTFPNGVGLQSPAGSYTTLVWRPTPEDFVYE